jgi:HlyD family secretion protein
MKYVLDRKISKSKIRTLIERYATLLGILLFVVVVLVLYSFANLSGRNVVKVDFSQTSISTVKTGTFSDLLNTRGFVEANTTVFLNTETGGIVEEKMVSQGAFVEKGQPLAKFTNTSLQLDVMSREAQVTEQLNFLRNTQMSIETNRLNLRRDLLEIDLEISHLERRFNQATVLASTNTIAKDTVEAINADLHYFKARKVLNIERQAQESSIRNVQLAQLEDSAAMLNRNLAYARANLDKLTVRSPVTGYLSEFNLELGESKNSGERLGQVDIPDQYKLRIMLDEFYLNQVSVGMQARVQINDKTHDITVAKIDSQVENAQFSLEAELPQSLQSIKRGQSLNVVIVLSDDDQNALLLPRGAFFSTSGGNWVFVLQTDGNTAERRNIRLGKKNRDYYQVLDGLAAGEQVIISSYSSFDSAQTLKLK